MADDSFITAAEKIAYYDRVAAIIEDRLATERYLTGRGVTRAAIHELREEAYCTIVTAVFGREVLHGAEPPRSSPRIQPQKSNHIM